MKTAVEWLLWELSKIGYLPNGIPHDLHYQAKQKNIEHITDAFHAGKSNGMDISHPLSNIKEINAEQYYNETFKSE